ncbi:hypothetical protein CALVIDRAFT_541148 [Calocera viscosa TUFC12733]|uniref:Uncharacterized protein n=1 Tax=Calocera viscosa (strain TUFC12733) TaxID=1330018 RepID=A0A167I5J1_CALVF|nr:hypothetical protein CALVIDRAFT_541148 [Calocera viscosa TUFC12733]
MPATYGQRTDIASYSESWGVSSPGHRCLNNADSALSITGIRLTCPSSDTPG